MGVALFGHRHVLRCRSGSLCPPVFAEDLGRQRGRHGDLPLRVPEKSHAQKRFRVLACSLQLAACSYIQKSEFPSLPVK